LYFLPSGKGRQAIIAHPSSPLTALSETQRAQALERFTIIRPALEKETMQAQVTRTHQLSLRTIHRLLMQVERILQINELHTVTKEVVEAARENLAIGLA